MNALSIDNEHMYSEDTPHVARFIDGRWIVSWRGDRGLTLSEAINAMSIAEWVGTGKTSFVDRLFLTNWAEPLGLTVDEAIAMCEPRRAEARP